MSTSRQEAAALEQTRGAQPDDAYARPAEPVALRDWSIDSTGVAAALAKLPDFSPGPRVNVSWRLRMAEDGPRWEVGVGTGGRAQPENGTLFAVDATTGELLTSTELVPGAGGSAEDGAAGLLRPGERLEATVDAEGPSTVSIHALVSSGAGDLELRLLEETTEVWSHTWTVTATPRDPQSFDHAVADLPAATYALRVGPAGVGTFDVSIALRAEW